MARPARIDVNNGESWDAKVNDNLIQLYDRPIPIYKHAGDLASLQTAYPAAEHDQCLAWVNYNSSGSPGVVLAVSDGTAWRYATHPGVARHGITAITNTHSVGSGDDLIVVTGSNTFDLTLPAIANGNKGRRIRVKHAGTGTVTVVRSGSDTIDGATSFPIAEENSAYDFVSDGVSDWHVVAAYSPGAGASTFLTLADTPGAYSGEGGKLLAVNDAEDGVEFVENAAGLPEPIILACSDEVTVLTTGQKLTFRAPFAFTLENGEDIRASVNTVSSSGALTIDIKKNGTTIFDTKVTIDANEKSSVDAAADYDLTSDEASFADDDEITIHLDAAGTGAKGLKVVIYPRRV